MASVLSCPLRWFSKTIIAFYLVIQSIDVVNKGLESFDGIFGVSDILGANIQNLLRRVCCWSVKIVPLQVLRILRCSLPSFYASHVC